MAPRADRGPSLDASRLPAAERVGPLGRAFVQTIGCQMSVHDGQRIAEQLAAAGYSPAAAPRDADVVVITTCSVREKAHQKVMSAIGRLRRPKERRPEMVVVVAGCVAEQEGTGLLQRAPHVDAVLGPDHLADVAGVVADLRAEGARARRCRVGFDDGGPGSFLGARADGARLVSGSVTVQKGCSEGCAFCIVPSVRGPMRCRPPEEVVDEVRCLVSRGAREIVLLGQTVDGYRHGETGFAELLAAVDSVPGVARIRYESAHPRLLTPGVLEAHASLPSLCEHLHLPVQSGSDRVLARMGRGHGRLDYLRLVELARSQVPRIGVSTDLVVGFPGEGEDDFDQTLELASEVRFDSAFSFKYSPRPGSPAAGWEDDVPAEVKAERLARLQELQSRITAERLAEVVGAEVEVLVEGESKAGRGQLRGRTRRNQVVNIDVAPGDVEARGGDASAALVGALVPIRVTEAGAHSLRGRLVARRAGLDGRGGDR